MAWTQSGYCFEFEGTGDWKDGQNEDWQISIYTPEGNETVVGSVNVDGSECVVYHCPVDGKYRAITRASVVL